MWRVFYALNWENFKARCQTYIVEFKLLAWIVKDTEMKRGGDYMKPQVYCNLCSSKISVENLVSTKDVDKSKVSAKGNSSRDFIVSTDYCCKDCYSKYFV